MKAKHIRLLALSVAVIVVLSVCGYFIGDFGRKYVDTNEFLAKRTGKTEAVLEQMDKSVRIGNRLPDRKFRTLEGDSVWLSDIVETQTLISYLRNPCGNCRRELDQLSRATRKTGDQSFFILISDSDPGMLRELERQHTVTATILCDSGSVYRSRLGIFYFSI